MKNILVPTDFSACATHAAHAALELAGFMKPPCICIAGWTCAPDGWNCRKNNETNFRKTGKPSTNTELLFGEWEDKAGTQGVPLLKAGRLETSSTIFPVTSPNTTSTFW